MEKINTNINDYHFNTSQIETDKGMEWYAECIETKAVVGGGVTEEEAIEEAKENLAVFLEYQISEYKKEHKENIAL